MKHHTERRARTPREDARLGPEKAEARPSGHWTTEKGAGRKGAGRTEGGAERGGAACGRSDLKGRGHVQGPETAPAPSTQHPGEAPKAADALGIEPRLAG